MSASKQQILNEQIKPLMEQVDAIAKEHGIDYLAAFETPEDFEVKHNLPGYPDHIHLSLLGAWHELYPGILPDGAKRTILTLEKETWK